jgi:integrase
MEKSTRKTFRNATNTITIIAPRGEKGTFKLRLETVGFDGVKTTDSKKFKDDPKLEKINKMFKGRLIDTNEAKTLLRDLKVNLLKDLRPAIEVQDLSRSNNQLLNSYLRDVYEPKAIEDEHKDITVKMAISRFKKVISIFGSTALISGERAVIVQKWKKWDIPPKSKKKECARVNTLLAFAGRDFTVKLTKREKAELDDIEVKSWVTASDLDILLPTLTRYEDVLAVGILFYSGMRTGELYGIRRNPLESFGEHGKLRINSAMTGEKVHDLPKSYKKRTIFIPSIIMEDMENWAELSDTYLEDDMTLFGGRLKTACRKLWPDNKLKHLSPHGLRRSFAKYMRSKGYAIAQVADLMGDSEEVVRKDYLGQSRDDEFWNKIADNF